jgi:hypothetical protein
MLDEFENKRWAIYRNGIHIGIIESNYQYAVDYWNERNKNPDGRVYVMQAVKQGEVASLKLQDAIKKWNE